VILVGDRLGVAALGPGKRVVALEPDRVVEVRERTLEIAGNAMGSPATEAMYGRLGWS
jgi:hypothetical protein